MIRIAATICFALTLLCPVFCLAGAEADGPCSDHEPSSGRNCEAMSVGALIAGSERPATPTDRPLPSIDFLRLADIPPAAPRLCARPASRNRANSKPPPAATRQALLQTFLF